MVVKSLDVKKDAIQPWESDEELLDFEVPYLSSIGALMYLAGHTWPNTSFVVNLLARYSSSPAWRLWNRVKHTLRYLLGTMDMGLYFPNIHKSNLIGYANVGYLSDPYNGRSQTWYLFKCNSIVILW